MRTSFATNDRPRPSSFLALQAFAVFLQTATMRSKISLKHINTNLRIPAGADRSILLLLSSPVVRSFARNVDENLKEQRRNHRQDSTENTIYMPISQRKMQSTHISQNIVFGRHLYHIIFVKSNTLLGWCYFFYCIFSLTAVFQEMITAISNKSLCKQIFFQTNMYPKIHLI